MTYTMRQRSRGGGPLAESLVVFAAVMMVIGGFIDLFRGIMGIAKDNVFVTAPNYVFKFDVTSWGWIHLVLGVLAIVVGVGLFRARFWARVVGVVVAGFLILANFLSIPYYPLWSLVAIALYAFVIWGLCTVRRDRRD